MSTSTMIRLVRWRVRDWATTWFYACRLPPVEPDTNCSTSTKVVTKAVVFNPVSERRSKMTSRKRNSCKKRCDQVKGSNESPKQKRTSKRIEDGPNDIIRSSPIFSEEEYMVFCFREDGAIYKIKEKRTSRAHDQIDHSNVRERPANQKTSSSSGEDAKETIDYSHVDSVNIDEKDKTSSNEGGNTLFKQVEKEGDNDEADWPPDQIKEVNHIETTQSKTVSTESIDSNRSDASTSSFAFPVLGWEWMGSPVQMPKPEGIRFWRRKARRVHLHCCRY